MPTPSTTAAVPVAEGRTVRTILDGTPQKFRYSPRAPKWQAETTEAAEPLQDYRPPPLPIAVKAREAYEQAKRTIAARIGCLLLALAFASPAWGQDSEPHAGPILPALPEIREAIQAGREVGSELRQTRQAMREQVAEAKAWRSFAGRISDRFDGKFLDRIGTLIWLGVVVAISAAGAIIAACVAYTADRLAAVAKAIAGVFRPPTKTL